MPGGRPRTYATEEEARQIRIKNAIAWRKNHPEQYQATIKKKKESDSEFYVRKRIAVAKYIKNNKEKVNKFRRENARKRREEDSTFKFKENVKCLIYNSFISNNKGFKKAKRTEEILGCTIEFFTKYILNLCPPNVTLKDFGRFGYHIDHIIPISSAKTEEDVIKLNHYTNLQPLWCTENIRKSNKIIENKDYQFLIYY